jgi:uncharacterized membrane protein
MLRLPSAVLDSLAAGCFAVIARQIFGRVGGVVMVILHSFTPLFINYGQEARPWAMLIFFMVLAALGQTNLLRTPIWRQGSGQARLDRGGSAAEFGPRL